MSYEAHDYPVDLTIDYPKQYDRLIVLFRILWAVPILVLFFLFFRGICGYGDEEGWWHGGWALGFVVAPLVLMILFRKKYPRWWFDWNVAMAGFTTRVMAYLCLLTDEYPSTDEEQSVHLRIDYPHAETDLMRGLPLIKWLLVIPHLVILWIINLGVMILMPLLWLVILFTGEYPRDVFDFVVGVFRWHLRAWCYSVLMTTDEYPPFRLKS